MRVKSIRLRNVMRHASTDLALPDTGVVLITGSNGAGKSSILEAVSVGVWDASLRRKPVWSGDKGSIELSVRVGTEELQIQRTKSKSKTALLFASVQNGSADLTHATRFENKTKAQEALEAVVGEHALWKRTHIFSSSDADTFTRATDSERKRMLEALLGLDRFDDAAAAVGKDRRAKEAEYREAERRLAQLTMNAEQAAERLSDLAAALETARAASQECDVEEELEELDAAIAAQEAAAAELAQQERQAQFAASKENTRLGIMAERLQEIRELGATCERCEQPVPHEHTEAIVEKLEADIAAAKAELRKHRAEAARVQAAMKAPTHAVLQLRDKRSTLKERERRAAQTAAEARQLEDRAKAAQGAAQKARTALEAGRVAAEALRASWANLEGAERVLSLGGVRAQLLGTALEGIESVANGWLDRMAPDMRLKLSPYSEKASGGVKDSISLEVEGAGNGHGYLAASGGERRRIDIALMLALAEVAEAASGTDLGTIFCDEVFDALDSDGVDAVCAVLDEIAATRCVVVISHSDLVKRRLKATRYEVDAGKLLAV